MQRNFIYAGRFQPFHNDHLQIVEWFIKNNPNERLVLAAVRKAKLLGASVIAGSAENFLPDRNPFGPQDVLAMTGAIARRYQNHCVVSTLIPQPSSPGGWDLVSELFPGSRVWLIPQRNEEWDEMKINYLIEKGDSVIRVNCLRGTSGMVLRDIYQSGALHRLAEAVPPEIFDVLVLIKKINDEKQGLVLTS